MMKVSAYALLLACSAVEGFHPNDDVYFHNKNYLGASIWHFSNDGLIVFSPEGDILKNPPKAQFCEPYEVIDESTDTTETVEDCRYFSLATDGHRYVWAGGRASSDRVEAFDLDTAERVGFTTTCRVPMDIGYHPGRREIFVHCHSDEIDVFSVHALGIDHDTITTGDEGPSARILIHSSLGSMGYSARSSFPGIAEIDLAAREVKAEYEFRLADSCRVMAYSPVNRHILVRPRMCCTCGFEGADASSCGRFGGSGPVNVTTGPSMGTNVLGTCGTSCGGTPADTIGVYEFDTVTKEIVGSHNINPTYGWGADPAATPDGRYFLLFGSDGGKAVTVLKPGENGQKSSVLTEIPVNFKGLPGNVAISDFVFVSDLNRNILILAASSDNDLVLVDMDSPDYRMRKLALTNAAESTGGRERFLEWAVGTNYVWVTGGEASELYVVEVPTNNIDDAKVSKTIGDVSSGELLFVDNFERKAAMQAMEAMINSQGDVQTSDGEQIGNPSFSSVETIDTANDDEDVYPIALAALIVALIAFLMSSVIMLKMFVVPADDSSSQRDGTSPSREPADEESHVETKTLGSKMVA